MADPTTDDVTALANVIAPALYEAVMEATADQWACWEHLTDFKREPYTKEARIVTAVCAPVLARVRAEALREAADAYGPAQITYMGSADGYVEAWLRDRADRIEAVARG